MFVPFLCIVIAAVLPYVISYVVVQQRIAQFGRIDNRYPRVQQAQLEGLGARARAAAANGFETFPLFAAAVLMAAFAGADPAALRLWSLAYVAMRVLHAIFYCANWDKLRTSSFFLATIALTAIYISALRAVG